MLSISHSFLFIHIPKTGGNSIQRILAPYSEDRILTLDEQDGTERFDVEGRFTWHKHATLSDYFHRVPPGLFLELFKFCVVRNPWSRAISFYFSPRRWLAQGIDPYWSRSEFLELLGRLPPMVDYLSIDGQIRAMDAVVRYERLAEQLPRVLAQVGIDFDPTQLPHVNRSAAGDYRSYFEGDPDLVDRVAERYRGDIETFDYQFEG
jgi:hypothetical protein